MRSSTIDCLRESYRGSADGEELAVSGGRTTTRGDTGARSSTSIATPIAVDAPVSASYRENCPQEIGARRLRAYPGEWHGRSASRGAPVQVCTGRGVPRSRSVGPGGCSAGARGMNGA
ncbi:hypothetical protein C8Q70DRAFT_996710 [Cubamyces menziesii]|nr:hypothetical protein C8Q70DRAFT_996710 [Cubamyces menziesii]